MEPRFGENREREWTGNEAKHVVKERISLQNRQNWEEFFDLVLAGRRGTGIGSPLGEKKGSLNLSKKNCLTFPTKLARRFFLRSAGNNHAGGKSK